MPDVYTNIRLSLFRLNLKHEVCLKAESEIKRGCLRSNFIGQAYTKLVQTNVYLTGIYETGIQ